MKRRPSNRRRRRTVKETGIDAAVAVLQAGITLINPTPEGALAAAGAAAVVGDVAKRFLSPREEDRVEEVVRLAGQKMAEIEGEGGGHRADLGPGLLDELLEGTLLAAKDTYEKKKLPLIANLLGRAPFTNTPIPNLVGTLHLAEQLTYRQLCILAVVWPYDPWNGPPLTNRPLNDVFAIRPLTEDIQGPVFDLIFLYERQLVMPLRGGQLIAGVGPGDLTPAELRLTYPALLLFNGMELAGIPAEDREEILRVLGANGLAPSKQG
jgi:hypothetical protein